MSNIQLTVRSISDTPTIDYHVRKHYNRLINTYNKLSSCHVVIDAPQRKKQKGKLFGVSIDLTVPGKELASHKQNENLFIAIRDSFDAVERLLERHLKKKQDQSH